jgi:Tfp pilus assembly protein PilF
MERIGKLKQMLEADPDDAFLQHALALEWVREGKDEEAKRLFERILSQHAGYIGSYYHLAKLYERQGNTDSAAKVYEQGMEQARLAGEQKALNELRAAYEELLY